MQLKHSIKETFYGFLCGIVLTVWCQYWFVFREQELTIIQLTKNLKHRNDLILEKNKQLIELYDYIILLEKQPVKPAPMWTHNE